MAGRCKGVVCPATDGPKAKKPRTVKAHEAGLGLGPSAELSDETVRDLSNRVGQGGVWKKPKAGVCPKCGGGLEYTGRAEVMESGMEEIERYWRCACGETGAECHSLSFSGHRTGNTRVFGCSEDEKRRIHWTSRVEKALHRLLYEACRGVDHAGKRRCFYLPGDPGCETFGRSGLCDVVREVQSALEEKP